MSRYRQPYTLHKRGKYWYYQTYDARGVRTSAKTTGQTNKTLARAYCDSLVKGNRLLSCRMKFREYAEGFYDEGGIFLSSRIASISNNTLKSWRSKLNYWAIPKLGDYDLSDITFNVVSEFRASLLRSGIAYSSVRQCIQSLKNVLKYAAQDNLMERIPFEDLEKIYEDVGKKDGFTYQEVENIVCNLPMDLRDLIILMALTGMRISEAYGVRQEDIKEENGVHYIHLTRQLQGKEYKPLKTKDSRDLPICDELIPLIHPLGWSIAYVYAAGNPVIRTCKNWQERKLTTHSFRHFFISETKNKGLSVQKVETYAGHSLRGIQAVYTTFHVEDYDEIRNWQKETLGALSRASESHLKEEHGAFMREKRERVKYTI